MIKALLMLFNSRKAAVWVLCVMVIFLFLSTMLPSRITLNAQEWETLAGQEPMLFWLASRFSTPDLVSSPLFFVPTVFLFLSTLVCTASRVNGWWKARKSEFSKDNAFSFCHEGMLSCTRDEAEEQVRKLLKHRKWDIYGAETGETFSLSAQRGISLGFWGSILFHLGLLICFIAVPVSMMTNFNGSLILTEGTALPLREAVTPFSASDPATLPGTVVGIERLRGVYAQGKYKVDFSGVMLVRRDGRELKVPFGVNNPAVVDGIQFSLQRFGYSPHVTVTKDDRALFDYYVNLRHPEEGDYFPLETGDTRLLLVLLPDFHQKGEAVGSLSREPNNPKLLFKVLRGETLLAKGMMGLGEDASAGEYRLRFDDLKNWGELSVTREQGVGILAAGFLVGISGLLLRFLSNERCLELELDAADTITHLRLRGYSRYYPAFLEREVRQLGEALFDRANEG